MFCLCNFGLRNNTKARVLRRYISVLYLTGDKAKENYVPLVPFMDFQKRLDDLPSLKQNISQRGLNIDLETLKNKYQQYQKLHKEKEDLEQAREDISKKIKKESDQQAIDELRAKGIIARNNLKSIKESIYPVEDEFIREFLSLPNEIHSKCPKGNDETLIYRNGLPPQNSSPNLSHLAQKDFIHYEDRDCYYLLDDAAQFELECTHRCRELFLANEFVPTSNPDFSRKVLMEANLTPPGQYHQVHEEDQRHNLNSAFLTGGGSFESFLGNLAKFFVYPSVLPLRMVSTGRQYVIKEHIPSEMGLYAATQCNSVQTLVANETLEEADQQMDDILNLAVDFYKGLGLHFKIVYVTSKELSRSEALKASIQVYSPAFARYVEVGSVSHYLDFVSQRILFNTKEKKETKFLHLVGGPIVQSSVLIAAMIENQVPLNMPRKVRPRTQADVFRSLFD